MRKTMWVMAGALLALTLSARAQLANPGFEDGVAGEAPGGWFVPETVAAAGWAATVIDDAVQGEHAVRLAADAGSSAGFGNLMQMVPAGPWRGWRSTTAATGCTRR